MTPGLAQPLLSGTDQFSGGLDSGRGSADSSSASSLATALANSSSHLLPTLCCNEVATCRDALLPPAGGRGSCQVSPLILCKAAAHDNLAGACSYSCECGLSVPAAATSTVAACNGVMTSCRRCSLFSRILSSRPIPSSFTQTTTLGSDIYLNPVAYLANSLTHCQLHFPLIRGRSPFVPHASEHSSVPAVVHPLHSQQPLSPGHSRISMAPLTTSKHLTTNAPANLANIPSSCILGSPVTTGLGSGIKWSKRGLRVS
ncbi:unnamed protein product [Protopolystoma xenopodis]|uniref:Uncharacterized protein n=1 Tax=Protopolystoma xenopodis TaxID=117903 RepID=A0A448X6T3_9PLAT|nr:unnamed protein product [Protopolystoma xenopodis]